MKLEDAVHLKNNLELLRSDLEQLESFNDPSISSEPPFSPVVFALAKTEIERLDAHPELESFITRVKGLQHLKDDLSKLSYDSAINALTDGHFLADYNVTERETDDLYNHYIDEEKKVRT